MPKVYTFRKILINSHIFTSYFFRKNEHLNFPKLCDLSRFEHPLSAHITILSFQPEQQRELVDRKQELWCCYDHQLECPTYPPEGTSSWTTVILSRSAFPIILCPDSSCVIYSAVTHYLVNLLYISLVCSVFYCKILSSVMLQFWGYCDLFAVLWFWSLPVPGVSCLPVFLCPVTVWTLYPVFMTSCYLLDYVFWLPFKGHLLCPFLQDVK